MNDVSSNQVNASNNNVLLAGHHRPAVAASQAIRHVAPIARIVRDALALSAYFACVCGAVFGPLATYVPLVPVPDLDDRLQAAGPLLMALLHGCGAASFVYGPTVARKYTYRRVLAAACAPYALLALLAGAHGTGLVLLLPVVAVGLTQGPLWCSSTAYIMNRSAQFVYFTDRPTKRLVPRLFATFHGLRALGSALGHFVTAGSFLALKLSAAKLEGRDNRTVGKGPIGSSSSAAMVATSTKHFLYEDDLNKYTHCGRGYCNSDRLNSLPSASYSDSVQRNGTGLLAGWLNLDRSVHQPSIVPLYALSVSLCLVAAGLLSLFVAMGKLNVHVGAAANRPAGVRKSLKQFAKLFKVDSPFLMLAPTLMARGFSEAFISYEVMKSYVLCMSGRWTVGYVLTASSLVAAGLRFGLPTAIDQMSRAAFVCAAAAIQTGALSVQWMWPPRPDDLPVAYVIAGASLMADTIALALCHSFIISHYWDVWEYSMAAMYGTYMLGVAAGYATCAMGCTQPKLLAQAVFCTASLIPLALLEYRLHIGAMVKPVRTIRIRGFM